MSIGLKFNPQFNVFAYISGCTFCIVRFILQLYLAKYHRRLNFRCAAVWEPQLKCWNCENIFSLIRKALKVNSEQVTTIRMADELSGTFNTLVIWYPKQCKVKNNFNLKSCRKELVRYDIIVWSRFRMNFFNWFICNSG